MEGWGGMVRFEEVRDGERVHEVGICGWEMDRGEGVGCHDGVGGLRGYGEGLERGGDGGVFEPGGFVGEVFVVEGEAG